MLYKDGAYKKLLIAKNVRSRKTQAERAQKNKMCKAPPSTENCVTCSLNLPNELFIKNKLNVQIYA